MKRWLGVLSTVECGGRPAGCLAPARANRGPTIVGVLLRDTVVLWFVIFVLFGVWYWVIDGGGPDARRDGHARRYDFHFPQRAALIPGWADWRPGLWDYLFLGFSGSTQFGLSDTAAICQAKACRCAPSCC